MDTAAAVRHPARAAATAHKGGSSRAAPAVTTPTPAKSLPPNRWVFSHTRSLSSVHRVRTPNQGFRFTRGMSAPSTASSRPSPAKGSRSPTPGSFSTPAQAVYSTKAHSPSRAARVTVPRPRVRENARSPPFTFLPQKLQERKKAPSSKVSPGRSKASYLLPHRSTAPDGP